jgi:hypothetical protein
MQAFHVHRIPRKDNVSGVLPQESKFLYKKNELEEEDVRPNDFSSLSLKKKKC